MQNEISLETAPQIAPTPLNHYVTEDMTATVWREIMAQFPSGVTAVTTRDKHGQPIGSTVSAFSSLSLDPMLLLVCLDKRSKTLSALSEQQRFAVNILSSGQQSIALQCGSRKDDKFSGIGYINGQYGMPLINDACTSIECDVKNIFEGGDHAIIVGQPLAATTMPDTAPLLYHRGAFPQI